MKKSATSSVQVSGLFHRMFGVGAGAGNSLPVRKLMVAVLLLAAATFLGVFAVAQAQAADGTMTGVTLASDSPGTLTVSWKAPTPAPTDYRLRWAPVGSDFLSWNGTNETDRGNAYPAGDVTSLTLSGLSEGTEFNVQARARYHKGEHKDSPWSGPWAEASALVMSEPPDVPSAPAAPNLAGTVLTPEGHVMLLWQIPSDDSITGYQVLRGPDADSLVVIEQDTGSGGTSYTDTAPPTGQTHTYAVKARNAAGLSPLSNTVTATVPAAAPIIVWTVLTPEGQVMLLWQNPSDDSITGYQVLRGPDADSLVVIEEDTESSATSYTDTAPPAGQTHTYAVKARNAAGLSQISNTVTATVPPAAPNLVRTAVTPAGQVLLSWLNPANDSITGYQVLRGPDADSLVVIEQDTGSSGTSYTDTSPPAGQTHTYAVKARNAAGLSPPSNTGTASVPASEEEEELITARHEETESTLFEKGELVTSHSFGSGPSQGRAIWSDGETIWITRTTATARLVDRVADTDGRADAYGLSDMARQPGKDIRAMYGALNHHAHGIWSDGQTMWVSDDDRARIFTYSLQSDNYGNRLRTKEFYTYTETYRNLYADLRGLWSDGTHMWVADSRVKKIVAYTLGGQRNADLDLNLLDGVGNDGPTDIWSNGYTMWVADYRDKKIYAYRLSDGVRQPGLDYNNLESAGNVSPTGIWSNGKLMYVYDNSKNTLYSYRSLAPFPSLASLSLVSGTDAVDIGTFNAFDLEYSARLGRSISQVTVNYSAASDVGVEVDPPDADPNAPGHQVDLALTTGSYEEATEITVTATQDGETTTYGVRVTRVDVDAISNDATLSSLSLVDVNLGTFDSANLSYEAVVASSLTQTTVSLTTADPGARNLISPSDADDVATGHQVDLAVGLNEITIEVTASDAEKTTRRYVVALVRPSVSEFGWLVSPDFTDLSPSNGAVRAIWSNGTTMWATFSGAGFRNYDTLRAYDLDTKARLGDRDIVDHWIGYANGIWSDGEVVAVSETQSHRIYVYDLNSGGWRPWLGFRLDSSNHNSHGLWSDGVTLWVVDHADDKLYAYHWRGENPGDRRPELDFALTDGNGRGAGLWSDGTTMWVSDGEDAKIYAYSLDSATYGLRVPALDFNELAPHGNASPNGIWSNGSVMWVADDEDNRLYSYKMPALPSLASLSLSGIEFGPFRSWQSKYAVRVPVGGPSVTTVSAVANNADQFDVKIAPSDSDALTDGHQVELPAGTPQTIAVTVTKKTDPCVSRTYTLRVKLAVSGPAS